MEKVFSVTLRLNRESHKDVRAETKGAMYQDLEYLKAQVFSLFFKLLLGKA